MDYLEKYGIKFYINVHDAITLYGASRMAGNMKEAMNQISQCFVDTQDLQIRLEKHITEVMYNEATYFANGVAGAAQLCTAVCMTDRSDYNYMHLPDTEGLERELLVFFCQHNRYDRAIETVGGSIRYIGDADETLAFDLEGNIDEKTAAVVCSPSAKYQWGPLSLEETMEIAHRKGVSMIVNTAAQLPSVENLWRSTRIGVDMVVFSNGKTLCGPQTSRLIVGKESFISDCIRFGSPMHGIYRDNKTSRESMTRLYVAIDNYMEVNHEVEKRLQGRRVERLVEAMEKLSGLGVFVVEEGPVGQTYRRAFGRVARMKGVRPVVEMVRERGIYTDTEVRYFAICFSPSNLTDEECGTAVWYLNEVMGELRERQV